MTDQLAASMAELEELRESLTRLLESHAEQLAVLAHDSRGPLTAILGNAELIEAGELDEAGVRAAAATIRRNVQRLTAIVNGAVTTARVEQG
jgi:signal transduction histidine kinase